MRRGRRGRGRQREERNKAGGEIEITPLLLCRRRAFWLPPPSVLRPMDASRGNWGFVSAMETKWIVAEIHINKSALSSSPAAFAVAGDDASAVVSNFPSLSPPPPPLSLFAPNFERVGQTADKCRVSVILHARVSRTRGERREGE